MKSVHSASEALETPGQILHHVELIPDFSLVNLQQYLPLIGHLSSVPMLG